MAKGSRKRPPRSEKDPTGCMWGLINMFDFRQGHSSTKLLTDRKHDSRRHFGTKYSRNKHKALKIEDIHEVDEVDQSRGKSVNLVTTSIKTLVEDDMSRVHPSEKIPSEEIEEMQDEIGFEIPQKSISMDPTGTSSLNFDLAALMIKFYSDNRQYQENYVDYRSKNEVVDHWKHNQFEETDSKFAEKQVMLHKSLVNVADVFLSQQFIDTKQFSAEVQSQEFMDALEVLNTNKELILRLLQDPDSLLLKLVQDHQNSQAGKPYHLEETGSKLDKESRYKLFRKKDKLKETKSSRSDSSHAVSEIVVLKPTPRARDSSITASTSSSPQSHYSLEDSERVSSHFSLREIKKRLKQVIGGNKKNRHVISMEGILHRIPYGSKDSGDPGKHKLKEHQPYMKTENSFLTAENDKRALNRSATSHPLSRESFNEKAKKHVAQMLDSGDDGEIFQARRVSRSLGRLLSIPECKISSTAACRQNDTTDHLSPLMQALGRTLYSDDKAEVIDANTELIDTQINESDGKAEVIDENIELIDAQINESDGKAEVIDANTELIDTQINESDDKAEVIDANTELVDTQINEELCPREDLNQKGSTELVAKVDIIFEEECDRLDANSHSDDNEPEITNEIFIEEGSPTQSGQGSPQERSPATTPSRSNSCSSLLKQTVNDPESILEKPEQPSPISVLEPSFLEDVNISGSELVECPIFPQIIHFEEYDNPVDSEANPRTCIGDSASWVEYVRVVLEISGLSSNEISSSWLSSHQLLDPSSMNEVRISYTHLPDDPKILFDSIGEVLVEIQKRFFSCTPWVSFVKHNVRPIPIGESLVQEVCRVIGRHLQWQSPRTLDQIAGKDMEGETWMELRDDMEIIVIEMGNAILEHLMEETILEMWDE